ncbi:MAG TPA: cellulase family glycosylhydrolase [Candidatus Moranbacteria bacterium]|nr:cellulase family glycosylhydrolase [Candidatus Moranbacteria bacterium]HRZ34088.1 cellulase family glycosylhydrolase [Candidatus Moranbacteria bacterium]
MKIFKKIAKFTGYFLSLILALALLFFIYINLPVKPVDDNAKIGVTFSARYAQDIGLDWRQAYLAMLDDLKIKYIRIPVYWDLVEKNSGEYDFSDIDWQLSEAQKRDAKIILVIGQKVPRWPECFIPEWVGSDDAKRKEKLLTFEETVVNRYKNNHPEIASWQIENEPFLDFGVCPSADPDLLDAEIAKVKSLDSSRTVVITDSGELSLWIEAAKRADIFGTTMYREVYTKKYGHWRYPIGPNFFKAKQLLIKIFADQDNIVVIELQGEPWVEGWTVHAPIERQLESMNAEILRDNIGFAKKTGINEIYIWGVEWWYWMKETQNNSSLWEMAKSIINQNNLK